MKIKCYRDKYKCFIAEQIVIEDSIDSVYLQMAIDSYIEKLEGFKRGDDKELNEEINKLKALKEQFRNPETVYYDIHHDDVVVNNTKLRISYKKDFYMKGKIEEIDTPIQLQIRNMK